jgi:hypothetical protein
LRVEGLSPASGWLDIWGKNTDPWDEGISLNITVYQLDPPRWLQQHFTVD